MIEKHRQVWNLDKKLHLENNESTIIIHASYFSDNTF